MIIPTPIIETFDISLSKDSFLYDIFLFCLINFSDFFKSSDLIVKVKSVSLPLREIFCTTISTFIEFWDNGLKMDAATPGRSLTPTMVIFASFFVEDIPVIIWSLKAFEEPVIKVPDFVTNEDLTWISILFSLASWTEVGCITFDPKDAISNISS